MPRDACLFNIMELSSDTLKKVLPKASTRLLARLASAYPRAAGRSFLELLSQCVSPVTLEFLREEINVAQPPSFQQIHRAESELMKLLLEENPPCVKGGLSLRGHAATFPRLEPRESIADEVSPD